MALRQWDFPGGGQLAPVNQPAGGGGDPPNEGELDWFEDFRLSLTDKGMTEISNNAEINRVPVGSATGTWPSGITHVAENVFVVGMNSQYEARDLWPAPAIGEYLFARMLLCNNTPEVNIGVDHGFETNIGLVFWFWRMSAEDFISSQPNHFVIDFGTWDAGGFPNELELVAPKDTVLRFEWRVQRTGPSTAVVSGRVVNNQTGVLIDERTGMPQSGVDDSGWRQFLFGMSGQAGATYNGGSIYWGGIAFRVSANANDWIGNYPVGPESA